MNSLVIDLFAGGGGASEGIRMALGRGPLPLLAMGVGGEALHHPSRRRREASGLLLAAREG